MAVWTAQKTPPPSPSYSTPKVYTRNVLEPLQELSLPLVKEPLSDESAVSIDYSPRGISAT
jgi:hypothetical protein